MNNLEKRKKVRHYFGQKGRKMKSYGKTANRQPDNVCSRWYLPP
jgi:hypothetical protein